MDLYCRKKNCLCGPDLHHGRPCDCLVSDDYVAMFPDPRFRDNYMLFVRRVVFVLYVLCFRPLMQKTKMLIKLQ